MKKEGRGLKISIAVVIFLIIVFILIRSFGNKEVDDVSPNMNCEDVLLRKVDILWITPKFDNIPISENKEWCEYILSLNKTLGLHGVYHTYNEFGVDREQEYLQEGIDIFEECFGIKPAMFKAPQLNITSSNRKLVRENNMEVKNYFNQVIHKVYHCNQDGRYGTIPKSISGFFIKARELIKPEI